MQIRELDLSTMEWRRVDTKGQSPPFRLHSSAAVVADKWIIHGGRRAGKFNITNDTFVFATPAGKLQLAPNMPGFSFVVVLSPCQRPSCNTAHLKLTHLVVDTYPEPYPHPHVGCFTQQRGSRCKGRCTPQ